MKYPFPVDIQFLLTVSGSIVAALGGVMAITTETRTKDPKSGVQRFTIYAPISIAIIVAGLLLNQGADIFKRVADNQAGLAAKREQLAQDTRAERTLTAAQGAKSDAEKLKSDAATLKTQAALAEKSAQELNKSSVQILARVESLQGNAARIQDTTTSNLIDTRKGLDQTYQLLDKAGSIQKTTVGILRRTDETVYPLFPITLVYTMTFDGRSSGMLPYTRRLLDAYKAGQLLKPDEYPNLPNATEPRVNTAIDLAAVDPKYLPQFSREDGDARLLLMREDRLFHFVGRKITPGNYPTLSLRCDILPTQLRPYPLKSPGTAISLWLVFTNGGVNIRKIVTCEGKQYGAEDVTARGARDLVGRILYWRNDFGTLDSIAIGLPYEYLPQLVEGTYLSNGQWHIWVTDKMLGLPPLGIGSSVNKAINKRPPQQ